MVRALGALLLLLAASTLASAVDDPPSPPGVPLPTLPWSSPEARHQEGLRLAKAKEYSGAERAYRDAIRLRPQYPEAWNGLGYVLRKQGRFEDSIRAYQEALRLRPDYPQALEYLGEAYAELGRLDEARAILAKLRSLDPKGADELAEAIQRSAGRR
jgi:tetratricopeptide (TPR) repeat protein